METLKRQTFTTSRLLEFTSQKELELQTGMPADLWGLVVLKELTDNALDACEEARVAPVIAIAINSKAGTIAVADNGPGIPASTVAAVLDFTTRTSSREAYASPTRGAQGNALKTVLAMPFARGDGRDAVTEILACGLHHTITVSVDAVQQMPIVSHVTTPADGTSGTAVTSRWPLSAIAGDGNRKRRDLYKLPSATCYSIRTFLSRSSSTASVLLTSKRPIRPGPNGARATRLPRIGMTDRGWSACWRPMPASMAAARCASS